MSLEHATQFRLFVASNAASTHEDVESVRERLGAVADAHDVEYRETDVASMSEQRVSELHEEFAADFDDDEKPYYVDNRVLNADVFGTVRPVLVVEYEDRRRDVYPHRNDDVSDLPIGVEHFLDEVQSGYTADRGDFAAIHGEETDEDSESPSDDDAAILGDLKGTLTSVLPV